MMAATCEACRQPMESGQGCTQTAYEIAGKEYQRIPYGGELWDRLGVASPWTDGRACHDCAVKAGQLHHPGCDIERCPRCLGQSISCGCEDESDEEAAATRRFWENYRG